MKKRYEEMTTEEKTEHNLKVANRLDKASMVLLIVNVIILGLSHLDKIIAFLSNISFCLN